jgi:hypothetical protein
MWTPVDRTGIPCRVCGWLAHYAIHREENRGVKFPTAEGKMPLMVDGHAYVEGTTVETWVR